MARDAAGDEELFRRRQVGNALGRGRGIGPGPGGKLVNKVVAGKYELFGCHLARCAEGGSVRDWGPAVSEGVEGGMD